MSDVSPLANAPSVDVSLKEATAEGYHDLIYQDWYLEQLLRVAMT
jgi:hypothetical protein